MNGVQIVDADGHVLENEGEIAGFFEGSYAGLKRSIFSLFPSLDGWPRGTVKGLNKTLETNASIWLDFLASREIEAAVLYPTAGLALGLVQDYDWACGIARAYNNWLYESYIKKSSRLKGVALLPVHDVKQAVLELRRAVTAQSMVAGMLPAVTTLYKGYGHPDFHPLYEEAQRLDVPLAIHGAPSKGLGFDFLQTMSMIHTLEHPLAQMIQITSVVLDGVFDNFPKLRMGFLEAGAGWVPYMMERMDEKFHVDRKRKHFPLKKKPSDYFRDGNVYITCEIEEKILDVVVREFGEDWIMFPSDFPHEKPLEEFGRDIPQFLERGDLSTDVKRKILYDNAKRFYRI
jgi:predicted TIM-barrel fold metal-dependent hydrolase